MRRHPRLFLFAPDGATSAQSSEAALEAFGDLANLRPELAEMENREQDRLAKGKPPERTIDIGRPVLDEELMGAGDGEGASADDKLKGETDPKAARTAPPAKGSNGETGSDEQSLGDEDADLDALVEKYQGKTTSMAKALRGLRSLQTQTAEERNELEKKLEAAASVLDSDYEWVDGKPVLKPEVAARHLRSQGQRQRGPLPMPTEAEIRVSVEAEFRKAALDIHDEADIPRVLEAMKPLIDMTVKERAITTRANVEAQRYQMLSEVGAVVDRHLREHPDDKDILPAVDKLYGGIPEELRPAAILEEWLPFGEIADLVRLKAKLPSIVKDAYALGRKHRGQAGAPTEAGAPGRSRPAPQAGRGSQGDADRAFKDQVIRGTGLPSLDSILTSR